MSTQSNEGITLVAASALSAYTRVYVDSSGQAALAGADNQDIGVVQEDVASGGNAPIRLWGAGSMFIKTSSAITAGGMVYPAANGTVSGSKDDNQIGLAAQAATASGDVIEIIPTLNA